MKDVIIIGQGPAGLSAALYVCRAGFSPLIIGSGESALTRAEKIENYFGLETPVSGQELLRRGQQQAQALGATFLSAQITDISWQPDGFSIATDRERSLASRTLLLATGAGRKAPSIPGLSDLEGHGVSYCAVCDGFFHRGNPVCVLGNGPYARQEAQHLLPLASSVTVLTNGQVPAVEFPAPIMVRTEPILALQGEGKLSGIRMQNGEILPCSGLFVALGVASASALARKIGASLQPDGTIQADRGGRTSVPGLFAAGDCLGGLRQIATAVSDGARAAMSIIEYLRQSK